MAGASVWLILAFYRKDYYVCAQVGPDIRKRNETDSDKLKEYDTTVETAGAESQIFAWAVFVVMVFSASVVVISKNCCLKDQDILDGNAISIFILNLQKVLYNSNTKSPLLESRNLTDDEALVVLDYASLLKIM